MSIQKNVDLGFLLRLYSVGCEPKSKKSINHHNKMKFLEDVKSSVGEEVWDIVCASPLGVIIRFVENKFTWSSKIVKHLLVNQLACKKNQEMWCLSFYIINTYHFSCIITTSIKSTTFFFIFTSFLLIGTHFLNYVPVK